MSTKFQILYADGRDSGYSPYDTREKAERVAASVPSATQIVEITPPVKYRTITMTDRPPVRIREDQWEVIASGSWFAGEIESQADRSDWIKVRQHADGRVLVYGGYTTRWQGDHNRRGGELLAKGDDIVAAIRRVADAIGALCVTEVINDLPAEEI